MQQVIIAWIVSLITSVAPIAQVAYYPAARETQEERQERYESMAQDALEVAYDPNEAPLFKGPKGRARTLAVILAIASYESDFRRDVDYGEGTSGVGDGGKSWCLMQVQLGKANAAGHTATRVNPLPNGYVEFTTDTTKGYGGEDLVSDRKACFRAGLHIVRSSFAACHALPLKDRLRSYASGSCEKGRDESVYRMSRAIRWMAIQPPMSDDDIQALFPLGHPEVLGLSASPKPGVLFADIH